MDGSGLRPLERSSIYLTSIFGIRDVLQPVRDGPGIAWEWEEGVMRMMDSANDFIIAPQGPLTLQDALVHTHQLSVRIPVR